MRLHYLQHVPFEGLAQIQAWADVRKHDVSATRLYEDQPLPRIDEFDCLVVMGGPMSVHDTDRYPWLRAEKQLIESAVAGEKLLLGVCLGAQLLADVLGASVEKHGQPEIGWFPVQLTPQAGESIVFGQLPESFTAFHWHGERFGIPPGATRLAESEACPNQAFEYGRRAFGLQFHLESTPQSIEQLIHHCHADITRGPFIQTAEQMLTADMDFPTVHSTLYTLLDRMTLCR